MENSPEMPPGEPTSEIPSELPAVVVLGAGLREESAEGPPEPYRLDKWSKMRTIVAGMMFEEGLASQIILSGGKLFERERSSVAESMKQYLRFKFPQIPEDSIILEEESIDTSENAKNVTQILKERNILGAIILTNEPHLPRAEKLFRNYGAKVFPMTAVDKILKARSARHTSFIEKLSQSDEFKNFAKRERILRGLLYIDPRGKIPHFLTRKRKPKK